MTKGDTPPKPKPRPPVTPPGPGPAPSEDACAEPLTVTMVASSPVEVGTQVFASIREDLVVAVTAQGDIGPIDGENAARIVDCSRRRWAFPGTVADVDDGLVTIRLVPRFRS